MDTGWSKTTKHLVSVGLILFGLYVIYLSRTVLTFLVVAALIAFLLMPLIDFLQKRLKLPRGAAVLLAYVLLIIILLLSPLILVPPIISGFNELADIEYRVLFDDGLNWTIGTLRSLQGIDTQILGISIDLAPIVDPALAILEDRDSSIIQLPSVETILNSARAALTVTVGVAANVAGSVFSGVIAVIFTFLFSVYISLDAKKFAPKFLSLVPRPYRAEVATLLSRLRRIWRAYFRGQLQLMLIIGVLTWIVGLIIGLPNAFTLAVLAGLLELIPNLGPFLALIPAVLLALIQGSTYLPVGNLTFAIIVVGCYILIQQIENNLIVPRVLGDAVELPALVVLVGVAVGAAVAGILGALLAAPVIASTREIIGYLYAKILGETPYPPQKETPEPVKPSWSDLAKSLLVKWQHSFRGRRGLPSDSQTATPETPPKN